MYKNKRILGLIPARGGSKGLPGKNIKPLLGKPLLAWTVEQARTARYLDRVIVTTDDENIARVATESGAEVPFYRPDDLAADTSLIIDTILYVLDQLADGGEAYDYLALLEPTSPLRDEGDIDRAISTLIENEERADSLMYVGRVVLQNPLMAKRIDGEGYLCPFLDSSSDGRRQELPDAYIPYGVCYLSKTTALREYRTFYQQRTLPLVTQRWQNYEIDDIWDFLCIEAVMQRVVSGEHRGKT